MSKKLYPADTLRQVQHVLTAWKEIDPSLQIGPITSEAVQAEVDAAEALNEKIVDLQLEIQELRNQRDDACIRLWNRVKSVRWFMKGTFGDDSIQYKLVGGTPISEIKRKRRKSFTSQEEEPSPSPE